MELPHLGRHCAKTTCKQLDFLPVKCDACEKTYCKDHILYAQHNCEAAYKKDVQVPVCPLCNRPVPVKRGEPPDIKVGQHIDTECQSDPAKHKQRIYTIKCSRLGCKQKEMIDITCRACNQSFCLKHRHPQDHGCCGSANSKNNVKSLSRAGAAALSRFEATHTQNGTRQSQQRLSTIERDVNAPSDATCIQGNLSEDEALARALQLSLLEVNQPSPCVNEEEEENRRQAETLNASEAAVRNRRTTWRGQRDLCNVC